MMLSDSQRRMVQTKGVVIGRVLMGLLFFGGGMGMLLQQGPESVAADFGGLGIPSALVVAWAVIVLKIGAGGALIIGRHVGCAAGLLILFTLGTILIAHMDVNDVNLFKNLAIVGGLLYVAAFGAGKWS